jgi:hypothetical protein
MGFFFGPSPGRTFDFHFGPHNPDVFPESFDLGIELD